MTLPWTLRCLSSLPARSVQPFRLPLALARWTHGSAENTPIQPDGTPPKPENREVATTITTLNPARLTSADYTDISSAKNAIFMHSRAFFEASKSRFYRFPYPRPFPPNTSGFLYLHTPPSYAPALASEIRFRITKSSDPLSFFSGHDLQFKGLPWGVPLIFGPWLNSVIKRLILLDPSVPRMISDPHHALGRREDFQRLRVEDAKMQYSQLLWAVGKPFWINLAVPKTLLVPAYRYTYREPGRDVDRVRARVDRQWVSVPSPRAREGEGKPLLSGTVVARFEHAGEGTDDLHVRILKIATQIEQRADIGTEGEPSTVTEGGLLPLIDRKTGQARPFVLKRPPCMQSLPDVQLSIEDLMS